MSAYEALESKLVQRQSRWLVTGAAGFIGSHLYLVAHALEPLIILAAITTAVATWVQLNTLVTAAVIPTARITRPII